MKARKGHVWNRTAAIAGVVLLGASVALAAGELDPWFGGGSGIVTTPLAYNVVDLTVQTIDGRERYLAAGQAPPLSPTTSQAVVLAYKPDGTPDTTFGARGDGTVYVFGSDPNGVVAWDVSLDDQNNKVLVAGTATARTVTTYGKNKRPTGTKSYTGLAVVRLKPDGSLDTDFNRTGMATVWAGSPDGYDEIGSSAVAVPGGGVLASGVCYRVDVPATRRTAAQVTRHTFFAKFLYDGTLDPDFGTGGIAYDPRSSGPMRGAALLQSDGKIVVGGNLDWSPFAPGSTTATAANYWAVSRFKSNGQLDTDFGSSGRVIVSGAQIRMVTVNANDDSIVAVGDGLLARYDRNGTPDPTFDGDGYASFPAWGTSGGDLALEPDGSVVFCGGTLVGRFTALGAPDPNFGVDGFAPPLPSGWYAFGIAEAADGIVVGGRTGGSSIFLARYGK